MCSAQTTPTERTYCTCIDAVPQAGDYASNNHLGDTVRGSLQSCTNAQNGTTKPNTLLSADCFACKETEERAEEAALRM